MSELPRSHLEGVGSRGNIKLEVEVWLQLHRSCGWLRWELKAGSRDLNLPLTMLVFSFLQLLPCSSLKTRMGPEGQD